MIGLSKRWHPFAAWALAAVFVAPSVDAADMVALRAVTDLPRAGIADGRAIAWRNVGIVAESDWLDAEVKFARCVPAANLPLVAFDRSDSDCASWTGALATGGRGHQVALTFKAPRWGEGAPLVDLALRQWRAPSRAETGGEQRAGTVAELVVTQPLGPFDTFAGYSVPVMSTNGSGQWRSTFAGVTWYAAPGTRLELIADRGVETTSARLDRTLTLRVAHATAARSMRIATWTTRALDDRTDPWQVGAGLEITF